jgi:hypothetical protein
LMKGKLIEGAVIRSRSHVARHHPPSAR